MFYAFSQPAHINFMIFTVAGLGLAMPYAILSFQPGWLKWLPKPGEWMVRFKQAMGFPMIGTAIWLTWIVGGDRPDVGAWMLFWLLGLSFVVWLLHFWSKFSFWMVLLLGLAVSVGVHQQVKHSHSQSSAQEVSLWQPYSQASLDEALKTSRPVFVDFTASWCLTCKVNKKTALEDPKVQATLREKNVILLLADWTHQNDEITKAIQSFGRSGVPLYVYYPSDRHRAAVVLPEVITAGMVLDVLNR